MSAVRILAGLGAMALFCAMVATVQTAGEHPRFQTWIGWFFADLGMLTTILIVGALVVFVSGLGSK